jgi:hypothetical protein
MPDNNNIINEIWKSIPAGINDFGKTFFPDLEDKNRGRLNWFIGILFLIFLILIAMMIFFTSETFTRNIYLTALERKITMLNNLAKSDVLPKAELEPLFREFAKDLLESEIIPMDSNYFSNILSPILPIIIDLSARFLPGAIMGILFVIWAIFSSRDGRKDVIRGSIKLMILFGIVGIITSIWLRSWIWNLVLLSVSQIIFMVLLGIRSRQNVQSEQVS